MGGEGHVRMMRVNIDQWWEIIRRRARGHFHRGLILERRRRGGTTVGGE